MSNNYKIGKGRLEAFSDGVIAIIITIMVLEIKTPHGSEFSQLIPLAPIFLSYVLSFFFLGMYWNNHHHMLHLCRQVTGAILWANLFLLFWLSLIPFATAWLGESHFSKNAVALYGVIQFMAAISYWILQYTIIQSEGKNSALKVAIGSDIKGKLSLALYGVAILISFLNEWVSILIYLLLTLLWLIPDQRIEKYLQNKPH